MNHRFLCRFGPRDSSRRARWTELQIGLHPPLSWHILAEEAVDDVTSGLAAGAAYSVRRTPSRPALFLRAPQRQLRLDRCLSAGAGALAGRAAGGGQQAAGWGGGGRGRGRRDSGRQLLREGCRRY